MNGAKPSRAGIIRAIAVKDLRAFGSDRMWVFLTLLGLFWFIVIYYMLPKHVDETIAVGVHWTDTDAAYAQAFPPEEGIEYVRFDTTDALEAAMGMTDVQPEEVLKIGLDFPDDFLVRVTVGEDSTVRMLVDPGVPDDVREALTFMVREGAFALTGHRLPVTQLTQEEMVLGPDRLGNQVTLRDLMRPLLAFGVLMIETFVLGSLIASEVSSRTVTAVLSTPARTSDFLAAKGLVGTTVAFTEATVVLVFLRAFGTQPLILLTTLLLGAVLVTGVAFIAGASGRDLIGMIFYSMLFMIPMLIPPIATLSPGTASLWVKVLPTYGLVQAIIRATVDDAGWSEVLPFLAGLAAWCVLVFAGGLFVLKRKVESL